MWQAIGVVLAVLFLVVCIDSITDSPVIYAQEKVAFAKPELLAEALDRNSSGAVIALEGILTAEQAIVFEAAMLPAPNDEVKLARYLAARKALRSAGVLKTDPSLVAVRDLIQALPAVEVPAEVIVELPK